jgi:hypothetical protein
MKLNKINSTGNAPGHQAKPLEVKPVVVTIDIKWNKPWRAAWVLLLYRF